MPEPTIPTSPAAPTRNASSLCRIYWMLVGNVALFLLFAFIMTKRLPFFSIIDAACAAVLASLILVRYVDIRHFGGETTDGEPATLRHWRRYAATLTGIAVVAWVAAHTVGQALR